MGIESESSPLSSSSSATGGLPHSREGIGGSYNPPVGGRPFHYQPKGMQPSAEVEQEEEEEEEEEEESDRVTGGVEKKGCNYEGIQLKKDMRVEEEEEEEEFYGDQSVGKEEEGAEEGAEKRTGQSTGIGSNIASVSLSSFYSSTDQSNPIKHYGSDNSNDNNNSSNMQRSMYSGAKNRISTPPCYQQSYNHYESPPPSLSVSSSQVSCSSAVNTARASSGSGSRATWGSCVNGRELLVKEDEDDQIVQKMSDDTCDDACESFQKKTQKRKSCDSEVTREQMLFIGASSEHCVSSSVKLPLTDTAAVGSYGSESASLPVPSSSSFAMDERDNAAKEDVLNCLRNLCVKDTKGTHHTEQGREENMNNVECVNDIIEMGPTEGASGRSSGCHSFTHSRRSSRSSSISGIATPCNPSMGGSGNSEGVKVGQYHTHSSSNQSSNNVSCASADVVDDALAGVENSSRVSILSKYKRHMHDIAEFYDQELHGLENTISHLQNELESEKKKNKLTELSTRSEIVSSDCALVEDSEAGQGHNEYDSEDDKSDLDYAGDDEDLHFDNCDSQHRLYQNGGGGLVNTRYTDPGGNEDGNEGMGELADVAKERKNKKLSVHEFSDMRRVGKADESGVDQKGGKMVGKKNWEERLSSLAFEVSRVKSSCTESSFRFQQEKKELQDTVNDKLSKTYEWIEKSNHEISDLVDYLRRGNEEMYTKTAQKCVQMSQKMNDHDTELSILTGKLGGNEQELDVYKGELLSMHKQTQNLKDELSNMEHKLVRSNDTICALSRELEMSKMESNELQNRLFNCESQIQELIISNDTFKTDSLELKREMEQLRCLVQGCKPSSSNTSMSNHSDRPILGGEVHSIKPDIGVLDPKDISERNGDFFGRNQRRKTLPGTYGGNREFGSFVTHTPPPIPSTTPRFAKTVAHAGTVHEAPYKLNSPFALHFDSSKVSRPSSSSARRNVLGGTATGTGGGFCAGTTPQQQQHSNEVHSSVLNRDGGGMLFANAAARPGDNEEEIVEEDSDGSFCLMSNEPGERVSSKENYSNFAGSICSETNASDTVSSEESEKSFTHSSVPGTSRGAMMNGKVAALTENKSCVNRRQSLPWGHRSGRGSSNSGGVGSGTGASCKKTVSALQQQLTGLFIERDKVAAAHRRLPNTGRSMHVIEEKAKLESRLEELEKYIGAARLKLRQMNQVY
eukprot:Nk52_evm29s485 gene=Nk52_evmTU29s485